MKPRLAENGDDLYRSFVALHDAGVITTKGIRYPVARIPFVGDFVMDREHRWWHRNGDGTMSGVHSRGSVWNEIHEAFEKDQVQIIVMAGSGMTPDGNKVLDILHDPSGNSFVSKS